MKLILAATLVVLAPQLLAQDGAEQQPPPAAGAGVDVTAETEAATEEVPAEPPAAELEATVSDPRTDSNASDEVLTRMPNEPKSLVEALTEGRAWLDLRYRFEGAERRGTPNRGWASTLRGALGYETAEYEGVRGLIEIESVLHVFSDPFFDSVNGNRGRALIPDPDGTEINQGYFGYDGLEGLDVRLGRQEISLGNERFVGADPWRQNHQSFDALRLRYALNENVDFDYSYAFRVHRVLGRQNPIGDESMSTHFFDVRGDLEDYGRLAGYALVTDFDDTTTLNSNTFGVRYGITVPIADSEEATGWLAGRDAEVDINLEYARQTEAGGNPVDISADYWLAEASAAASGFRFRVAVETLGGSGNPGDKFSTPFASYAGFNGFADQFGPGGNSNAAVPGANGTNGFDYTSATPDAGLEDRSIGLAYTGDWGFLPMPATASITYHWFSSDSFGLDYGTEVDLDLLIPLSDRAAVGGRYADFNSDQVYRNTNRFFVWATIRLL